MGLDSPSYHYSDWVWSSAKIFPRKPQTFSANSFIPETEVTAVEANAILWEDSDEHISKAQRLKRSQARSQSNVFYIKRLGKRYKLNRWEINRNVYAAEIWHFEDINKKTKHLCAALITSFNLQSYLPHLRVMATPEFLFLASSVNSLNAIVHNRDENHTSPQFIMHLSGFWISFDAVPLWRVR